jgi:mono/diheme cytochrome c family protein
MGLIGVALLVILAGCRQLTPAPEVAPVAVSPAALSPSVGEPDVLTHGAYVYGQYCAACHGPNGFGRTEHFPNLRRNPFVEAAHESVIDIVLHGRNLMIPYRDYLTDEDAAAVVSFIRMAWNDAEELTSPEMVHEIRWNLDQ